MSVFAVTGLTIRPDAPNPHHNSTHPTEAEAQAELKRLRDQGLISRTASTVYQLPDEEPDA